MPLGPGVEEFVVEASAPWISSEVMGGQSRRGRGSGSSGWEGETVGGEVGKKREERTGAILSVRKTNSPDDGSRSGGMRVRRRPWRHFAASHRFLVDWRCTKPLAHERRDSARVRLNAFDAI